MDDEEEPEEYLSPHFRENINKVRAIVNYFRNSDVRMEILHKNLRLEEKDPLELFIDMKVRWNTIYGMLERFLVCESAIRKSLEQLGRTDLAHGLNVELLKDLCNVLELIEITSKTLEKEGTNLLEADVAINWLLTQLHAINSTISMMFFETLKKRFEERRNKVLCSVIQYLHNPATLKEKNHLQYSTEREVIAHAEALMNRLDSKNEVEVGAEEATEEASSSNVVQLSYLDKLKAAMSDNLKKFKKSEDITSFQSELKIFKRNGQRSERINKLYKWLLTIQATSCESERTFSTAGKVCTKFRSRLSDRTLHIIVFLKYYLKRKNIELF